MRAGERQPGGEHGAEGRLPTVCRPLGPEDGERGDAEAVEGGGGGEEGSEWVIRSESIGPRWMRPS